MPTPENNRPSFQETMDSSEGKTLTECSKQVRAVATCLEELAWSLTVREIGRTLSRFAQHLAEDAQRLEVLALLTPTMEALPEDKKSEITARFEKFDKEQGT